MRMTLILLLTLALSACGTIGIEPINDPEFWDRIQRNAGG